MAAKCTSRLEMPFTSPPERGRRVSEPPLTLTLELQGASTSALRSSLLIAPVITATASDILSRLGLITVARFPSR